MADIPLMENPMTAVADTIVGGTAGAATRQKNNYSASAAPAVTDDSGDGYAIGSRWLDTTADKEYVALDVTVGAAVWTETTGAAGSGVASGTSNPGGPSSGDLFFRTDLDLLITYDGTRWVTVQEYAQVGILSQQLNSGISSSSTNFVRWLCDTTYDIYVTRVQVASFAGALSGSAFWTFDFNKVSVANSNTSVASANSSGDTSSNWTSHEIAVDTVFVRATNPTFCLNVNKTSTPGNCFLGNTVMLYRLIIT